MRVNTGRVRWSAQRNKRCGLTIPHSQQIIIIVNLPGYFGHLFSFFLLYARLAGGGRAKVFVAALSFVYPLLVPSLPHFYAQCLVWLLLSPKKKKKNRQIVLFLPL